MIHDPMRDEIAEVLHAHSCECLGDFHSLDVVVAMSLIARVRADERERAAVVVRQYAADTHPIHNRTEGCPRCYIAAALLVAANHVDGTAP